MEPGGVTTRSRAAQLIESQADSIPISNRDSPKSNSPECPTAGPIDASAGDNLIPLPSSRYGDRGDVNYASRSQGNGLG